MKKKKRPRRVPGKASLVAGCSMRTCENCEKRILVPDTNFDWKRCMPCRRGWTDDHT